MLLIAYDGSKPSSDAIDDLHQAGLPQRGMAAVLSVADTDEVADLGRRAHTVDRTDRQQGIHKLQMTALQREKLDEAVDFATLGARRVQRQLPDWHVESLVMTGHPARSIVTAARDCYAELVVLGSHGRSALERVLLGSVSRAVLENAHCSVRIGRRRPESAVGPLRVVIGLERSSTSELALHAVAVRDWPLGSTIHVIVPVGVAGPEATVHDGHEYSPQLARECACHAAELLTRHGLEATWKVVEHAYASAIVGAATSWGADLIVLEVDDHDVGFVAGIVAATQCSVEAIRPVTMPSALMIERFGAQEHT